MNNLSRSLLAGAMVAGVGAIAVSYQFTSGPIENLSNVQTVASATSLSEPKAIGWKDLLPDEEPLVAPFAPPNDFPEVNATPFVSSETGGSKNIEIPFTQIPVGGRQDLANKFVKLAGYMAPLNVERGKTRTFLLVPYVGACIHVPAPPANQIVLVETKEPIAVRKMWEPFEAVGTLNVETLSTTLADVSYTMDLNRIEKYTGDAKEPVAIH